MSSLDEYRRVNRRTASAITIGGFRPSGDPATTQFGLPPLALPNERWPVQDGKSLFYICQLNLSEAPFVPSILSGLALITVFIDPDAYFGKENGDGWLIREYSSLDGLQRLAIPDGQTVYRGFEARYDLVDDYPVYDDPDCQAVPGFDSTDIHLDNVSRTKIGGFASNIQSEQWWSDAVNPDDKQLVDEFSPAFCFQIATEDKVCLYWGDNGVIYFARSTNPESAARWFLDTQCF